MTEDTNDAEVEKFRPLIISNKTPVEAFLRPMKPRFKPQTIYTDGGVITPERIKRYNEEHRPKKEPVAPVKKEAKGHPLMTPEQVEMQMFENIYEKWLKSITKTKPMGSDEERLLHSRYMTVNSRYARYVMRRTVRYCRLVKR